MAGGSEIVLVRGSHVVGQPKGDPSKQYSSLVYSIVEDTYRFKSRADISHI